MVEWIAEPLNYAFFQRGMITGIMVAIVCGLLSGFVVWRGMSFIGDALAHAVLPGVVLAVVLGINLLVGAMAMVLLSVLAIGAISNHRGLKEDTAIGVIFTGAFALGIVLMSRIASYKDLTHILFGNILGISTTDLKIILGIGILVLFCVILFFKELVVTSFDPIHSIAIGLSPQLIHFGLLILIAATTVITIQTVGVVLVLALLITPAAAASLLAKKIKSILLISIALAVVSVILGFYASYYFNLATGGTIVLILSLFFGISFGINRLRK